MVLVRVYCWRCIVEGYVRVVGSYFGEICLVLVVRVSLAVMIKIIIFFNFDFFSFKIIGFFKCFFRFFYVLMFFEYVVIEERRRLIYKGFGIL